MVDLKTAEDEDRFDHNRRRFGYDRQAALYREIGRQVLAEMRGISVEDVPAPDWYFVVVYKDAPIQCLVLKLDPEDLYEATDQVSSDLRRLKQCYETGDWGELVPGVSTLPRLDKWKRRLPV